MFAHVQAKIESTQSTIFHKDEERMYIVTASRGQEGVFLKWSTLTFLESSKPKYAIRD